MNRIEVRPIELPRDTVKFVKAWWPIYQGSEAWVPPIVMERKDFFNPSKNPYFKIAKIQCWMAYRDGEAVGTIAATVDANVQKSDPGLGLFGFFEFVDDEGVARSLFTAAMDWLREQGMDRVRGPYNFSQNHEFGLRLDAFDSPPMIANPYNLAYYPKHYEAVGLAKAMDWYSYWLDNGPVPEKIERISNRVLERYPDLSLRNINLSDWDNEVERLWEIYESAWVDNWGHVAFNKEELDFTAKGLKQVVNPDFCFFIYKGEECVGVAITLPDFNQVAKKMNGRIFPFGWWHYLMGKRKIDQLRVFVLGIKKEYQNKPFGAPLYAKMWEACSKSGVRGGEASLILENNRRMRGALEKLGGRIYQTYRIYEMSLKEIEEGEAA